MADLAIFYVEDMSPFLIRSLNIICIIGLDMQIISIDQLWKKRERDSERLRKKKVKRKSARRGES